MKTIYKLTFLLLISVLTFSFFFCSKDKEEAAGKATTFEDSTIVADVNGEIIHTKDLDAAAKQIIVQTGLMNKVDYTDSLIQQQALELLIQNTLLRQEIENHLIEVKDGEIDRAMEQVKQTFESQEAFTSALQQENLTLKRFRENIVKDLKVQKLLEREIVSEIKEVPTEQAREYYKENPKQFTEPTNARARHVLIKVSRDASDTEISEARKKAELVLQKAKSGADFATLARDYSEGPNAGKGGDLGFFARGEMVKAFDQAVFSLQPGQISNVVRSELGFHVIKLEEYKDPEKIPFEKVEDKIKAFLAQKESNERFEEYINQLKKKAEIQISANYK
ncbi:hypothetical protein GF337_04505 [candidate division KSB1 bacterium]|nr:hypothetical protein [candidate division KSB1 bacterium]